MKNILFVVLFYILLKNLSLSFMISLKGIPSHFGPASYIRHVLLVIDKLPVEFSLLMRCHYYICLQKLLAIHPSYFFTILLFSYFFYHEYYR